jgi:hypothetical protein
MMRKSMLAAAAAMMALTVVGQSVAEAKGRGFHHGGGFHRHGFHGHKFGFGPTIVVTKKCGYWFKGKFIYCTKPGFAY